MKKYKKGTKFTVFSHKDFCNKGWHLDSTGNHYSHDDFPFCSVSCMMVDNYVGQILTVVGEDNLREDWYNVDECKYYIWPVATFLADSDESFTISGSDEGCKEGITPINGWIICKVCGKDLRKIK